MNDAKVHFVKVEMRSLDEYSQRELNAYRNIGTIREFRRLKHEDFNRKERKRRFRNTVDNLLVGALAMAMIEGLFFLSFLLA